MTDEKKKKGSLTEETITPEEARSLVASAENVRKLSPRKVEALSRAMRAGRFELNGETIIIGEDGALLNGFHRLNACIKAGVAFRTYVARGVQNTPDVRGSIDSLPGRTPAQRLMIRGNWHRKFASSACGSVRWYEALKAGTMDRDCIAGGVGISTRLLPDEVNRMVESMPLVHECIDLYSGAETWRIKKLLKPMAPFVGLYAYLGELDHALVLNLYTALKTGSVSMTDSAWLLAEYLAKNAGEFRRDPPVVMLAKFIKCWNGLRGGPAPKVLRITRKEKFPRAI
jgi:hypothetical protein